MSRQWRLSDISIPKTFDGALNSIIRAYDNVMFSRMSAVFPYPGNPERTVNVELSPRCIDRLPHPMSPYIRIVTDPLGVYMRISGPGMWLVTRDSWEKICFSTKWLSYHRSMVKSSILMPVGAFPPKQTRWLFAIAEAERSCNFEPLASMYFCDLEAGAISYRIHRNILSMSKVQASGAIKFCEALSIYRRYQ